MKTMFYKTDIGASYPDYTLYFANSSDLMDHLQECFKCTADEIEFSDAWRDGELFTAHQGNIDKSFCDFHNRIDQCVEYDFHGLTD
jgi:hypothetical protein